MHSERSRNFNLSALGSQKGKITSVGSHAVFEKQGAKDLAFDKNTAKITQKLMSGRRTPTGIDIKTSLKKDQSS